MRLNRILLAPAVVFAFVALGAQQASGLAAFDVTAAKSKQGDYRNEPQSATIKQGKQKTYWWRVKSSAVEDTDMTFDDAATGAPGYNLKWFKGKKNITEDVQGSGYEFTLKAMKKKVFHAEVKYTGGGETLCLGGQATDPSIPFSDSAYFEVNGPCS